MGLGIGGTGAARYFARLGARVTVTDKKSTKELKPFLRKLTGLPIRYVLGKHRAHDFIDTDLVVYSMGLRAKYKHLEDSPYLHAAIKHHVPLDTDIGIFFESVPREQIIGVTGTRGKSTTAALIAAMLKTKYPKTVLAGNIRTSVLEALPKIQKENFLASPKLQRSAGRLRSKNNFSPVVLELSSWQLEGLAQYKKSPHISVITSIFQDHLNTYKNIHEYLEAKKNIFRYQKKGDYAVLNDSLKQHPEFKKPCGQAKRLLVSWRTTPHWAASTLMLPGMHNRSNLAAALAVAQLYRIPKPNILHALKTFRGLEGRLEYVGVKRGVKFYNDTTATAPDAVIVGLRSFARTDRVILITGGVDKNLDYRPLADFLAACPPKAMVLLPGTATDKLHKHLTANSKQQIATSMHEAVRCAWHIAKKGDTILLSPGAASFNLFKNEFDRGEQFVHEMQKLKT